MRTAWSFEVVERHGRGNTYVWGWKSLGLLVSRATEFCTVEANIFRIIIAVCFPFALKMCYHFTRTEQKAAEEIHTSLKLGVLMSTFWRQEFRGGA
jgi:hypothetical protein